MSSIVNIIPRLVAFISILVVLWIAVTAFLPVLGQIVSYGESQGSFDSPLVPSVMPDGLYWSFELFVIGVACVVGLWLIMAALTRIGVGRRR